MRSIFRAVLTASAVSLVPALVTPCAAQGFGLGLRLAAMHDDYSVEPDAQRFTGGQLRARISPRTALELSLDLRTRETEDLTARVRDIPIQGSLLFYPLRTSFAPYVLGGAGWYSHRIQTLAGDEVLESESSTRFGWHAGFGAELKLGKHAGIHADYRYTFLHFGSDAIESDTIAGAIATAHDQDSGIMSRFLPSSDGSMWTAGFTIYF